MRDCISNIWYEEKALDGLQFGLDLAGLVPGFGEVADGSNALISLARGEYIDAALSALAMIPFVGWGATAGKGVKYGLKAADAVDTALKYSDEIVDVVDTALKYSDEAVEAGDALIKNADDIVEGAGDVPKYPGNDPVKVPAEGYEWRGNGVPGSKQGNWYNPNTKEWLRPDLNHPEPIPPHWDYGAPDGKTYRIYPDGTFESK